MSWLARLDAALARRARERSERSEESGAPHRAADPPMRRAVDGVPEPGPSEGASASPGTAGRAGSAQGGLSSHPSLLSPRGGASALPAGRSPGAPPEPDRGPDAADEAERAEREAIRAEPALPREGSPERERLDRMQRRMVRGLLDAAMQRPPAWFDPGARPTPGCRCTRCRGGRWWCEAGEAPHGWRCWACHPPDHLPADAVREVRT